MKAELFWDDILGCLELVHTRSEILTLLQFFICAIMLLTDEQTMAEHSHVIMQVSHLLSSPDNQMYEETEFCISSLKNKENGII